MTMITSDDVRTGSSPSVLAMVEVSPEGRSRPHLGSRLAGLIRRADPFIVVGAASAVALELGWLALLGAGLRRLFF